ncbi:hypothetical protein M899_3209 [Bacteriovorax sp. BSW11_IV]|uniref:DUF6151 family protein n=1 Tax=Bacteriovorax sp. BSW11_IV TaxID=1353529 RepID=UPI00038A4A2E|nr:DUF6151 family protein [Bacteriovorax sp. BSW11_IV]EQC48268.1 hypothetical protein M899_3209 [Bacteriovorax sp. BSW11_IV]
MDLNLSCSCNKVQGQIKNVTPKLGLRVVCYCDDCQTYARYLNGQKSVLDENGGTELLQVPQAYVSFHKGQDQIECVQLSPKGIKRWYAKCCHTPIGNMLQNPSVSFIGIPVAFIDEEQMRDADKTIGPVCARLQLRFATGPIKENHDEKVPFGHLLKTISKLLQWKIKGLNRPHPFYDFESERYIYETKILTKEERDGFRA